MAQAVGACEGGYQAAEHHDPREHDHSPRVHSTSQIGDRQAADDLTQEVFLRALAALPRFEGRSSARTWLLSIARRTVVDSLRHAAARPRLSDRDDWQTEAELNQPQGLPGFEDGIALAELLATIPAERKEAFVLTQLLGLPYAEAAETIGCPVGTVRSRVARARTSLIALLRDEEDAQPAPDPGEGATARTRFTRARVLA
ncbi:sigma-70 family RNA polymerase sigma factor [Streptomyces sp. NPDC048604]|uniref:sigma-70 family RNA polymerase sigma factor n=1 Tax=Streptomyces sp. NPDC048604 TaxID=3365578 RepID=UPI00371C6BDE